MKLQLTPFSEAENKIQFVLNQFVERDCPFAILAEAEANVQPNTNWYRFGLIDSQDNKFWFFNGNSTTDDRFMAIKVYNELLVYCETNEIKGKVFAYKEYEKRE